MKKRLVFACILLASFIIPSAIFSAFSGTVKSSADAVYSNKLTATSLNISQIGDKIEAENTALCGGNGEIWNGDGLGNRYYGIYNYQQEYKYIETNINVISDGFYKLSMSYSKNMSAGRGSIMADISVSGVSKGSIILLDTANSSWNELRTANSVIYLKAGQQTVKIGATEQSVGKGSTMIDWLKFTPNDPNDSATVDKKVEAEDNKINYWAFGNISSDPLASNQKIWDALVDNSWGYVASFYVEQAGEYIIDLRYYLMFGLGDSVINVTCADFFAEHIFERGAQVDAANNNKGAFVSTKIVVPFSKGYNYVQLANKQASIGDAKGFAYLDCYTLTAAPLNIVGDKNIQYDKNSIEPISFKIKNFIGKPVLAINDIELIENKDYTLNNDTIVLDLNWLKALSLGQHTLNISCLKNDKTEEVSVIISIVNQIRVDKDGWQIIGNGSIDSDMISSSGFSATNTLDFKAKKANVNGDVGFNFNINSSGEFTNGQIEVNVISGANKLSLTANFNTDIVKVSVNDEVIGNNNQKSKLIKGQDVKILFGKQNERYSFGISDGEYLTYSVPAYVPDCDFSSSLVEIVVNYDLLTSVVLSDFNESSLNRATGNGFESINGATVVDNIDGTTTFKIKDSRFVTAGAERSSRERLVSTKSYDVNKPINIQAHITGVASLHYLGIRISSKPYDFALTDTKQDSQFFSYFNGLGIANWDYEVYNFSYNSAFSQKSLANYTGIDCLDRYSINIGTASATISAIGANGISVSPNSINLKQSDFPSGKVYIALEFRIKDSNAVASDVEITLKETNISTKEKPINPVVKVISGQFIELEEEASIYEYAIGNGLNLSNYIKTPIFTGLNKNTEYSIYRRYRETNEYLASEPSEKYLVTTNLNYSLFFDVNGADEIFISPQTQLEGNYTKPIDPVKIGNTFKGWFTDINFTKEYDFASAATDLTLYAKWKINKYNLEFVTNLTGVTITGQSKDYLDYFDSPDMSEMIKQNYYFNGWYLDANFTKKYDFTSDVSENNITLYAQWLGDEKKVSFITNGSNDILDKFVHYNDKISLQIKIERVGYSFGGWFLDEELTKKFDIDTQSVVQDIKLYAKWIKNETNFVDPYSKNGCNSNIDFASGGVLFMVVLSGALLCVVKTKKRY